MNREKYIFDGLERHYEEFKKYYSDKTLLYLAIQGSQNYNLDIYTEEYKSDIDTKAIVLPTLEDIVMNKTPISTTHVCPNNEHLDIKDIRLMFDNFKKQNINFLEILFTDFYWLNPEYEDLFMPIRNNAELIAHYNINQAFRCMSGMSMAKVKALCHPYPSIIDKIEKYGYDGKQLHHIIRMNSFIKNYYLFGFKFALTNYQDDYKEQMLKAKLNQYTLEEAKSLAERYDYSTRKLKDTFIMEKDEINQEDQQLLYNVQYNCIKKALQEELKRSE